MRISQIIIKNYRSFSPQGETIHLHSLHSAFVGKNNSGKTNIFNALNFVLGSRHPNYIRFNEDDFFDKTLPIELTVKLSDFIEDDLKSLFSSPIKKEAKNLLKKKFESKEADIIFKLTKSYKYTPVDERDAEVEVVEGTETDSETEEVKDSFEIITWGFHAFKKVDDIRKAILQMLLVPAFRNPKDELSASKWSYYGRLMKEVLEGSPQYSEIKTLLSSLNEKIQLAFTSQKQKLLEGARIASYVDDIQFQLTKDNQPSELLRNLEIFIKENTKLFNIENVGTGTQSAVIIAILELALKNKYANLKLFCIEEPEVYIHPHGIRHLGNLIKSISSTQNTQILISTHSLPLVTSFLPYEIIRVDKVNGETKIRQDVSLTTTHFKRFINQDSAEIFFSDKVIFVEGDTEKILLSELSKYTSQDIADTDAPVCDFDKINKSIINIDGAKSIENYIKIADAFSIPYTAFLDKDFITSADNQRACMNLCKRLTIEYPNKDFGKFEDTDFEKIRTELKNKNILINKIGETEDLFSDEDIASITKKTVDEIKEVKEKFGKTSKAFKKIFYCGKAEYAIDIADYYIALGGKNPLEELIRFLYKK